MAGTSPSVTSTQRGIRIDSEAPATATNTTTNSAPGSSNSVVSRYSAPAAIPPPTIVPPINPNIVSREFTRTRSIVGGITRGG